MKVLITGVAGLLGANLADWIINNHPDCEVVGIDNLSGGYMDNVNKKVMFHQYDLNDHNIDDVFLLERPDIVYHFAAYAAEGLSPFIRAFNYENNLVGTARVINYCIKYNVKRLVYTSSMAVYGRGTPPFTEDSVPCPIDPYGVAKYGCEMDIKIAAEQHALDYCIIRPHNVYGPKQNIWDRYRNVLGIWMYQHMNGKPITVFGAGKQRRAFSYIDDILQPLWITGHSEDASEQIINLGGTVSCTIAEAAQTLIEVMGGGKIEVKQARHEVTNAFSSYEKSQRILGYKDNHSLVEGLTKMWSWAQDQPERPQVTWNEYELDKGIYDYWK